MKRLLVILCLMAVLLTLSPALLILAQPSHIPHENPAAAKGSLDKVSLLVSYGDMFNRAAISQYPDAQGMLNELKLAEIPTNLRDIIYRYNSLSGQLFTSLDDGESLLNEAFTLFSHNQVSAAIQRFDEAEAARRKARALLEETRAATKDIGDSLGVFTAPATSQASRQAYNRLVQSLMQVSQSMGLIPVELSLSITQASVFVGDSITASGRLGGGGQPLPQRTLTLFLNKRPFPVTTGPDGWYTTSITIPYEYVSTMTLHAEYFPSGADINTYRARQSPPVEINTIFYSTVLDVSAPATAYPGLPLTVSGQVGSPGGSVNRFARVLLDGDQLAQETIPAGFGFNLTLPRETSTGRHTLAVAVAPEGRYSGVSKSLTVDILRLAVESDIQMSRLVIISIGLLLIGLVSLGALARKRGRRRARPWIDSVPLPPVSPEVRQPLAAAPAPAARYAFTGIKGRILSAYFSGVKAVQETIAVSLTPHTTVREFLEAAGTVLPVVGEPFAELTAIAEVALYSARTPDEAMAVRAEQFAASIKEELHSGIA